MAGQPARKISARQCHPLFYSSHTTTTLLLPMAPLYKKGDRVKCLATRFDEGSEDRNGDRFSIRYAAAGNGTFCFGSIAHVHALTSSNPMQTCRVKHDDGESHKSTQAHLFPASLDDDGDSQSEDSSADNQAVRSGGGKYTKQQRCDMYIAAGRKEPSGSGSWRTSWRCRAHPDVHICKSGDRPCMAEHLAMVANGSQCGPMLPPRSADFNRFPFIYY